MKLNAKSTQISSIFKAVVMILISVGYIYSQEQQIALKGSYASSIADGVDIFSGKLEQIIPLINVQGRGAVGEGLYLPIRNTEWGVQEVWSVQQNDKMYRAYQAQQPYNLGAFVRGGYGRLGSVIAETRFAGWYYVGVGQSVTTLQFVSNNGSIINFRDVMTNGEPYLYNQRGCVLPPYITPPPPPQVCSRGRVFRAIDGSNATFVADGDIYDIILQDPFTGNPSSGGNDVSGTLYLADGTKISVGENSNTTKIVDRNGNQTDFEYLSIPSSHAGGLHKIVDSLKREVVIEYGDSIQQESDYFDEIIYKGFGGGERRIRITYKKVSEALAPGHQMLQTNQLFPGVQTRCNYLSSGEPCDASPVGLYTIPTLIIPRVVSSVTLPNQKEYRFYYNSYFELSRMVLPTGAYVDYEYSGLIGANPDGFVPPTWSGGGVIYRRISSVKTYSESGQLENKKELSNVPQMPIWGVGPTIDNVTIDIKDGSENILSRRKHYFYNYPMLQGIYTFLPWVFGKEFKTEVLNPDTQAILRRSETVWEQREPFQWCGTITDFWSVYPCDNTNYPHSPPLVDPRVAEVKTTLETGQVTKKTFSYDQYNNITDTYEYDFGNGQAGQFLRRSHTDYVTDPNYTSHTGPHLKRLPSQTWISSDVGGNNKAALIQYEYDNYSVNALVGRDNVSGHDAANFGTGNTRRGNPTKTTSFSDAQNQTGAVSTQTQYDILGNVIKTIDAKGFESTIDYSDRFGSPDAEAQSNNAPGQLNGLNTFAFATSATNQAGYTGYTQFDYFSGSTVDAEDLNGNVSTMFYNDVLDRPTQVINANNRSSFKSQATTIYDDLNKKVTVTSDLYLFNDNLSKGESFYDSMGRTTETRSYETGGYIITGKPQYDSLGRVVQSTNPYRPYLNEQPVWTTTTYDNLGRVSKVRTPDNAEATTIFDGNITTAIDQAGKKRRSVTNAIGQVTRVDEPNGANDLGDITSPTQATSYTYNTNGNLVKVTQGQQNRYFLYDSLGRLLRVRQPEQGTNSSLTLSDPVTGNSLWSTGSTYDANGNVLSTLDAKGVLITQTYDNLNRPLTSAYSDGTPPVSYEYDNENVANSIGKMTKVSSSVSTTEYTEFDILGKVKAHRQTTDGQSYATGYLYNLTGAMIEETYPSGRVVKNTLDNDGKLVDVSGKAGGQLNFHTYANSFVYAASGAVTSMRYGNGRWESAQFNSRLQVTQIGLGTSSNATNLWKVNYSYGEIDANDNLDTLKNNGSVAKQTINYSGLSQAFVQSYKYDSLSRLTEAKEMSGTTQTFMQNFGYDRYGNRTSFNHQKIGEQQVTTTPTVDPATNRFVTGQGFVYDLNGNLITDNQGRQFVFNGDNKQKEVRDAGNNIVGQYLYDGSGARVKKVVPSTGETTIFVYDAGGKLVAEYSTATPPANPTISYLTNDTLGSPRVVTDNSGAVISRRDFMPFGEELYAGTASRTTAAKYSVTGSDNVRKRFTGYEKDTETGLDFAEARYYDNRYGRFTAVDPLLASGRSADPQTFNRYAYVAGDPINRADPSGMDWWESRSGTGLPFLEPGTPIEAYSAMLNNVWRPGTPWLAGQSFGMTTTTTTTTTVQQGNPFAATNVRATVATFTSVRVLEEVNGEVVSDSSETSVSSSLQTSVFRELWKSHPDNNGMHTIITDANGNADPVNQCALRFSAMLLDSRYAQKYLDTFNGIKKAGYAINAKQMANWITTVFGKPITLTGANIIERLNGKTGIVYLDHFRGLDPGSTNKWFNHLDLWDGKQGGQTNGVWNDGRTTAGRYYNGWFSTVRKVLFWEVK